jgi:hypothetical protein
VLVDVGEQLPDAGVEVLLDHASRAAEGNRPGAVGQRTERRERPLALGGAIEPDHREELPDFRSGALQPPELGSELHRQRKGACVLSRVRSLTAERRGHAMPSTRRPSPSRPVADSAGRPGRPRTASARRLQRGDVDGLRALVAGLGVEGDPRALGQRLEAVVMPV